MKKKIIYSIFKKLIWLKKNASGYVILNYHDIVPNKEPRLPDYMAIEFSEFKKQIDMLMNEFQIISLPDIIDGALSNNKPEKLYIGISFDDGYLNQYNNAVPYLEKNNIPATFFITTAFSDQTIIPVLEKWKYWIKNSSLKFKFTFGNNRYYDLKNNSDKALFYKYLYNTFNPDLEKNNRLNNYLENLFSEINYTRNYMNWEEINQLNQNLLFNIGAHSITHQNLINVSDALNTALGRSSNLEEEFLKHIDPALGNFWKGMSKKQRTDLQKLVAAGMNVDEALEQVGFGATKLNV